MLTLRSSMMDPLLDVYVIYWGSISKYMQIVLSDKYIMRVDHKIMNKNIVVDPYEYCKGEKTCYGVLVVTHLVDELKGQCSIPGKVNS